MQREDGLRTDRKATPPWLPTRDSNDRMAPARRGLPRNRTLGALALVAASAGSFAACGSDPNDAAPTATTAAAVTEATETATAETTKRRDDGPPTTSTEVTSDATTSAGTTLTPPAPSPLRTRPTCSSCVRRRSWPPTSTLLYDEWGLRPFQNITRSN
ncbi:MAG: hypothetical protein R2705_13105 [Ilumatobacteraceae bacterium]